MALIICIQFSHESLSREEEQLRHCSQVLLLRHIVTIVTWHKQMTHDWTSLVARPSCLLTIRSSLSWAFKKVCPQILTYFVESVCFVWCFQLVSKLSSGELCLCFARCVCFGFWKKIRSNLKAFDWTDHKGCKLKCNFWIPFLYCSFPYSFYSSFFGKEKGTWKCVIFVSKTLGVIVVVSKSTTFL